MFSREHNYDDLIKTKIINQAEHKIKINNVKNTTALLCKVSNDTPYV